MGVYERGFVDPSLPSTDKASASQSSVIQSALTQSRWASPQGSAWLIACSLVATAVVFRNLPAYAVYPFDASFSVLRQVELVLFWVGWLALCFGPAAIAVLSAFGRRVPDSSVLALGIAWPTLIIFIQVSVYFEYGDWFLNYLQSNQLLFVSDVLAPAALIVAHFAVPAATVVSTGDRQNP